jgi:hypothetical protein
MPRIYWRFLLHQSRDIKFNSLVGKVKKAEGSPNETSFTAKHESGIFSTPYSPLPTPHFQVSHSWAGDRPQPNMKIYFQARRQRAAMLQYSVGLKPTLIASHQIGDARWGA